MHVLGQVRVNPDEVTNMSRHQVLVVYTDACVCITLQGHLVLRVMDCQGCSQGRGMAVRPTNMYDP